MTRLLSVLAVGALGLSIGNSAGVSVVPLSEDTDPVRLSAAEFRQDPAGNNQILVRVENNMAQPLSTSQVWFTSARFFTQSEMVRNGDRVAYSCGSMARPENLETIAPGAQVVVTLSTVASCRLDITHEHFFVIVHRIAKDGRFTDVLWQRQPEDFARLLQAAMPHP